MYIRYFFIIFCLLFSINVSYSGGFSKLFCCCFAKKSHSNEIYDQPPPEYDLSQLNKDLPIDHEPPPPYRSEAQEHIYKTFNRIAYATKQILSIKDGPKYLWVDFNKGILEEWYLEALTIIEYLKKHPKKPEMGDKELLEKIKPSETLARNLEEVLNMPEDKVEPEDMIIALQCAYSRPQ